MTIRISDDERRRRLARRHLLVPGHRSRSVPAIADALVAIHSSDPVTVFLAFAARGDGVAVADVERALYDDTSVIRHHAMRRTLWVTTPAVGELVHAACTRKIAATERRRAAEFVGDAAWFDRAVEQVTALVRSAAEPLSTREIGEHLPGLRREIVFGAGTKHEATGSAHTRAVLVAAFDGAVIRRRPAGGSWIGSQYAWGDADRWCPADWSRHDEHDGAVETVRRWLERFGPGTLEDLVWWTGTTKTLVRRALGELDVTEVELGGGPGLVLSADLDETPAPEPWAAVLPGLDPTAMGWRGREWYLDETTRRRVTDRFGNIGPTVWVDGRIVGGWAQRPDGSIATELTHDVGAAARSLIEVEATRVSALAGDTRFRVRFPSPNQRDLLA